MYRAKIILISCFLSVFITKYSLAEETDNHNWGTHEAPYQLNEYSREDSTITIERNLNNVNQVNICNDPDITCINANFSTATAQFDCSETSANGGWGVPAWGGQCGTADGASYGTAPTRKADMCARGNPTTATSNGTDWVWTCQGSGTSGNANCSAEDCSGPACAGPPTGSNVNGTCGPAQGGTYASAAAIPSGDRCLTGTATGVSTAGSSFTWSCNGTGSGTDDSCTAGYSGPPPENGACRSYGSTYSSQPASNTSNGCNGGTYADYSDTSTDWRWRCNGQNGGSTATCSASKPSGPPPVDGDCIIYPQSHGNPPVQGYASQPATNDATGCIAGTYSDWSDGATDWRWRCRGANGGTDDACSVNRESIDGQCKAYTGNYPSAQPATNTANGCDAGTFEELTDYGGMWRWRCKGFITGTDDQCSASKAPPPGSCTYNGNTYGHGAHMWNTTTMCGNGEAKIQQGFCCNGSQQIWIEENCGAYQGQFPGCP